MAKLDVNLASQRMANIRKIPLAGYILEGEDGEGSMTIDINGDLENPDVAYFVEYSGFTDTTNSFELANRHIFDFDPILESDFDNQKEDWVQYSLRFVKDFRNNTVDLTILISSYAIFAADGGFEHFQLEYDHTDNVILAGGIVFYETGDDPGYQDIGDNDRLLFELE